MFAIGPQRLIRQCLALAGAILLASCGVSLPDAASFNPTCAQFMGRGDDAPDDALFFVSTALPDCRGDQFRFAGFRYTAQTYGENDLDESSAEPWKDYPTQLFAEDVWFRRLESRLDRKGNDGRVLVYVHGFNTGYPEALKDAYRLSRLTSPGVPVVVVNWPSHDSLRDYSFDEASMRWAQANLDALVERLAARGADITLVGHSLGAQAVSSAVERLDTDRPDLAAHLSHVVLASPDMDRDAALRPGGTIWRLLGTGKRRVLVYASFRDRALRLSRMIHGYARLGSTDCTYDVADARRLRGKYGACHVAAAEPRLALVETGYVDGNGGTNHSDFVKSCPVRADLSAFLRGEAEFPLREEIRVGDKVGYRIAPALVAQHGVCPD